MKGKRWTCEWGTDQSSWNKRWEKSEGKKAICKNWRCIFTGGGRGGVVLVVGGLGGSVKTTGLFYDLKRGLKWPEMNTKLQLKGTFFNTSLNLGSCKRPHPLRSDWHRGWPVWHAGQLHCPRGKVEQGSAGGNDGKSCWFTIFGGYSKENTPHGRLALFLNIENNVFAHITEPSIKQSIYGDLIYDIWYRIDDYDYITILIFMIMMMMMARKKKFSPGRCFLREGLLQKKR